MKVLGTLTGRINLWALTAVYLPFGDKVFEEDLSQYVKNFETRVRAENFII